MGDSADRISKEIMDRAIEQKITAPQRQAARERAELIRALDALVTRYHGDAGCPRGPIGTKLNTLQICPACDAAAILARVRA